MLKNSPPSRRKLLSQATSSHPPACSGCGNKPHLGGHSRCPAFGLSCNVCGKLGHFAKVCHSKTPQPDTTPTSIDANALSLISTIRNVTATDPAPNITLNISSLNGCIAATILPDLGADISAAGEETLAHLNEYIDNLLPSTTVPKAANGTEMHPGKNCPSSLNLVTENSPMTCTFIPMFAESLYS